MNSRAEWGRRPTAPSPAKSSWRVANRIGDIFDRCTQSNRRAVALLLLVSLFAFLPGTFAIPVLDRDEARFAVISQQMVETGNLADVRIGTEWPRTRPLGQHWLQAAVVATADALGVRHATRVIGLYRLPSLGFGLAAVLLTFWAALAFVGRRAALFAALLLATSAAVGVAARVAVPDAALLAASAAMIGALGRHYMRQGTPAETGEAPARPVDWRLAAIFWGALAGAFFIKGLITPIYPALALATLIALDRSPRLLRGFAPLQGLGACLAVGLVWFLIRHYASGADWPVPENIIGRVTPAFPGLGIPPGSYFLMFWGLFWPAAPLAALAVPVIWAARQLRAVRYLLAWLVPAWVVMEFLPAKIPGYAVPLFPAIAILVALAMERGALALSNTRLVRLLWLWPVIGALIAVLALLGLALFDRTTSLLAWPLLLVGFFALVAAAGAVRELGLERAALLAMAGMLVSGFGVMQLIVPQMRSVWISPRLASIANAMTCAPEAGPVTIGSAGYNEPSLAFLLPGRLRLLDGAAAADFLNEGGCRLVFVERRQEARFVRRAESLGMRIERGVDIDGFEYTDGRRLRISVYRKPGS